MRICHVVIDMHSGGAQTFLVSLAREQAKTGNEISILLVDESTKTPFEQQLVANLRESGIKVIQLGRRKGKNLSIVKCIRKINEFVKENKPEIVNTHLGLSHFVIVLYKLFFKNEKTFKHIITVHTAPEGWNFITELKTKHTATIYCSYSAERLSKPRDCLSIAIQNGIADIAADNSAEQLLATKNVGNDRKLVLCVGRISSEKNYAFILKVAKEMADQNVSFVICGAPGNAYESVETLLKQENIIYLGVLPPNTIFSLLKRCDCFLNASIYEGLPITVLEAFFAGIPCVLSFIMPHEEIGTNMPYCYLPETFDEIRYKEVILNAIISGNKKESILEERGEFLSNFKIKNTAKKYIDFYEVVKNS